jgi:hypothetical protein
MATQSPQARPKHATRHACAHACSTPAVARLLTHSFTHCHNTLTLKPWSLAWTHTHVQPSQGIRAPTQHRTCAHHIRQLHAVRMCQLLTQLNRTLDLRAPPASHSYLQMQVQRAPRLPREAHTTLRPTGWVGGEYRVAGNSSQARAL